MKQTTETPEIKKVHDMGTVHTYRNTPRAIFDLVFSNEISRIDKIPKRLKKVNEKDYIQFEVSNPYGLCLRRVKRRTETVIFLETPKSKR